MWIFKKDVGFFREIHLWLFESDKHVNCFSVNNTYQKNLFFFYFKETCVVPLISSICMSFPNWDISAKKRIVQGEVSSFIFFSYIFIGENLGIFLFFRILLTMQLV